MALIAEGAKIGENVEIGPYTQIGAHVEIGAGTRIHGQVVIDGHTSIGRDCEIYPFVSIGLAPQSKSYKGEETTVEIGDRVTLREQVSIHRGTVEGGGKTVIGDDGYIMLGCHIAHDCIVGKKVQMANLASLTGHVHLGDGVVCGGDVGFAPFVRIGDYSFITASSKVRCHAPPYALIFPEYRGEGLLRSPNYVGMERIGKDRQTILAVKKVFHILFEGGGHYKQKLDNLTPDLKKLEEVQSILDFLANCPLHINTMRMLTKYRRPANEIAKGC